ncbi:MAG: hypothetical protein OEN52_00465 [Gammaproteobacteria bacterium]|nr:hypothetical protein [Gammaproteobacteria bacterium]MDH3559414.1 hypothetical protein [Gammaproteobacteria bacterium]
MVQKKSILMLGRRDPTEAMRVAAGLTIFGHMLSVVFLVPVPDTPENIEMAELLEFSDIESKTTLPDQTLPHIGADALAAAVLAADAVINI